MIHRDLKPENVFVCPRGGGEIAKLVDFGIARARHESRLTAAGSLIGTPAYIAPERVRGHENDPSSDLYSLGVVFFEMITGRLPFLSNDIPGFLLQHLEETPPSPGSLAPTCTTMLESLILRLLEKEPGRRPVDAHQVVRELEAMAASLGRVARADLGPTLPPEPRPSLSAPVTLERWEQRTIMLEQMLLRAYPEGAPRALMTSLDDLRDTVVRLDGLRRTASVRQRERDIVQERLPEVRGRLGHAVHALGADLSTEREALRKLRLEVEEREAKVADLEMQIAELRAHLTEEETKADTFGAAAEQELASMGVEIERLRLSAAETTRSLLTVLRTHPACASLVRDFA